MQDIFTLFKLNHTCIKIESNYLPGVPRFTVLNFGPSLSKELSLKLRSALSSTGFFWRLRRQALFSFGLSQINLKDSPEMDLAIFIKYLSDTKQIDIKTNKKIIAYGSVSIHGKVESTDLSKISPREDEIWIGNFKKIDGKENKEKKENKENKQNIVNIECISDLKKISGVINTNSENKKFKIKKQNIELSFIDLILVYGTHSKINLNSDKCDIKKCSHGVFLFNSQISSKNNKEYVCINASQNFLDMKKRLSGRNQKIISIEDYSLLDDREKSLLFSKKEGNMLFAETKLCPCGKAKLKKPRRCGFSLYKCRSVVERLSVSGLSCFDIFQYKEEDFKTLSNIECINRWKEAKKLRDLRADSLTLESSLCNLKDQISKKTKLLAHLPTSLGEERLKRVLLLARSIADLNGNECIEQSDLDMSLDYGFYPLKELVNLF